MVYMNAVLWYMGLYSQPAVREAKLEISRWHNREFVTGCILYTEIMSANIVTP